MPKGNISLKIDELFTRWINLPETQKKIDEAIELAKNGINPNNRRKTEKTIISPRPPSPNSLPRLLTQIN